MLKGKKNEIVFYIAGTMTKSTLIGELSVCRGSAIFLYAQ